MNSSYKKQLLGWLSYAFASEVFVVVSLTLFLPICLEQFARDNGFLEPDYVVPCSSIESRNSYEADRCAVKIGWVWIDTASFSLYVYSLSVALQALTVISMGSIADRPLCRKPLLLIFALIGSSSATLFLLLPSSSPLWILCAAFAICANVGFGVSGVAMNAYLPSLARASPEVVQARINLGDPSFPSTQHAGLSDADDEPALASESLTAPLLILPTLSKDAQESIDSAFSRATSRISSIGVASGYVAGIVLLLLALIPVSMLHGSSFSLRLAIGLSGIWWAIFSVPAAIWLPSGMPDELLQDAMNGKTCDEWSIGSEILAAWKRLGMMLHWRNIKRLRHTFRYLAAWFLLSDGFTTMTSTAVLFAKTTLHMQSSWLVLIGALAPAMGIFGSLAFPYMQRTFAWSNLKVLLILVIMVSCIPAYGCLGFVPFVRNMPFGGLTTPGEMFVSSIYFGFAYGAFQSYARACYAELIPQGEEARWYGLFSITDKSSSFVGPLMVGLIADITGNIRYAFFFLLFMIWVAVPVLFNVDVDSGRTDALNYHSEERLDEQSTV